MGGCSGLFIQYNQQVCRFRHKPESRRLQRSTVHFEEPEIDRHRDRSGLLATVECQGHPANSAVRQEGSVLGAEGKCNEPIGVSAISEDAIGNIFSDMVVYLLGCRPRPTISTTKGSCFPFYRSKVRLRCSTFLRRKSDTALLRQCTPK